LTRKFGILPGSWLIRGIPAAVFNRRLCFLDLATTMTEHLMNNYARLPVAFIRGEGAYLWDDQGRRYLDALSGIAVCSLGHAQPRLTAAIAEQAATLLHTSNIYRIPLQERLADRLCEVSGMDRVFFCNSGAEANEAAIKIARLYGHGRDIDVPVIVAMEGSFHGRTMATLTATGNPKVQAGFEPLVPGFLRVPYDDVEALKAVAARYRDVVAVMLEPVQGEGGVRIPAPGYLRAVRELCDENGWLMMLDEVQSGMCRTGRWFAFQHESVTPDVLMLAKALGNGVPVGACLGKGAAAELLRPGSHGTTFGGNLLASRAAMAVIDVMTEGDFAARAASAGAELLQRFRKRLSGLAGVRDVRGKGMMIAVELDRPCAELVGMALAAGLLINVTADCVVRLLPPLVYGETEIAQLVDTLGEVIGKFLAS
jgi:acetylornithine aminotransferase